MSWLLRRLREPSTWRGLVWLAAALGVTLEPMAWEYITAIGMATAGLLGVLLGDEPKTVRIELPPPPAREAQMADAPAAGGRDPAPEPAAGELRGELLPRARVVGLRPPIERPLGDQFSGGWGDR